MYFLWLLVHLWPIPTWTSIVPKRSSSKNKIDLLMDQSGSQQQINIYEFYEGTSYKDLGRARETNKICESTRGNWEDFMSSSLIIFLCKSSDWGYWYPVPCICVTARTMTWQGVSKKKNHPNSFLLWTSSPGYMQSMAKPSGKPEGMEGNTVLQV